MIFDGEEEFVNHSDVVVVISYYSATVFGDVCVGKNSWLTSVSTSKYLWMEKEIQNVNFFRISLSMCSVISMPNK